MITLKLPYSSSDEFQELLLSYQKEQTKVVKISYNKFKAGLKEKEVRNSLKSYDNLDLLDSWFIQSAIYEGKATHLMVKEANQKAFVFGGLPNLKQYLKGKITKDEYKLKKLLPLSIIGEKPQNGNRKVELSTNSVKIKFDKNNHFNLTLPKLRNNYKAKLNFIIKQSKLKQQPFSIKINKTHIFISFEEERYNMERSLKNRVLAIDLNPNNIGISILTNQIDRFKVLHSEIIDIFNIHAKINTPKICNKKDHELYEISHYVKRLALEFKVKAIVLEELTVKGKNHAKGKAYNRTVNNNWNRNKIINCLKKICNEYNIGFEQVNPAYSSVIGNINFKEYPDPICASIELGRRSFKKKEKDGFYPKINQDNLNEQWKQTLGSNLSWVKVSQFFKNSKMRYRVSSDNFKFDVFKLKYEKNKVKLLKNDLIHSYIF